MAASNGLLPARFLTSPADLSAFRRVFAASSLPSKYRAATWAAVMTRHSKRPRRTAMSRGCMENGRFPGFVVRIPPSYREPGGRLSLWARFDSFSKRKGGGSALQKDEA